MQGLLISSASEQGKNLAKKPGQIDWVFYPD